MTKGLRSSLGFGSGKSKEVKKGEVAVEIFKKINQIQQEYEKVPLQSRASFRGEISFKEKLLLAQKITQSFALFVYSEIKKGEVAVTEDDKKAFESWDEQFGKEKISFNQSEMDFFNIGAGSGMKNTINSLKEAACGASKVKANFFSYAVANFLPKEIEQDQKYIQNEITKSSERTKKSEKSDQIFSEAHGVLRASKLLQPLTNDSKNDTNSFKDLEKRKANLGESSLTLEQKENLHKGAVKMILKSSNMTPQQKSKEIVKVSEKLLSTKSSNLEKAKAVSLFPDVPTHKIS